MARLLIVIDPLGSRSATRQAYAHTDPEEVALKHETPCQGNFREDQWVGDFVRDVTGRQDHGNAESGFAGARVSGGGSVLTWDFVSDLRALAAHPHSTRNFAHFGPSTG